MRAEIKGREWNEWVTYRIQGRSCACIEQWNRSTSLVRFCKREIIERGWLHAPRLMDQSVSQYWRISFNYVGVENQLLEFNFRHVKKKATKLYLFQTYEYISSKRIFIYLKQVVQYVWRITCFCCANLTIYLFTVSKSTTILISLIHVCFKLKVFHLLRFNLTK